MSINFLEPAIHPDSSDDDVILLQAEAVDESRIVEPNAISTARRTLVRWVASLAMLIFAFGSGWWVATQRGHRQELLSLPEKTNRLSQDQIAVTVSPVDHRSIQRFVEAVGTLHGFEEVTLSSKQEGRVLRVYHDMSSVVQPGERLLELDPTDAKLARDQADRNVQTELAKGGFSVVPAESEDLSKLPNVVSARLRFELAQSRLQRLIPLKSTNSISAEDFEQSKSEALVLESDWQNQLLLAKSAAAMARLRNAELAIASQRLRDIVICAPTPTSTSVSNQTYAITERLVSEGTLVRPGTEVFRLVFGRTLKLKLSIPELHSGEVVVGQSVEVLTGSLAQGTNGTVARISPAVDRSTRTFMVEVDVPNDAATLKPGSFARAKILIGQDTSAITIKMAGLYSFAGIHKIFLARDGVAREVKVTLGQQTNDWVEIATPMLPDNSVVITSGQRLLSDSMPISIRESAR